MINWKRLAIWLIAGAVPLTVSWGSFVTVGLLHAQKTLEYHEEKLDDMKNTKRIIDDLRLDMRSLQVEIRAAREHLWHLEENSR